MALGKVTVRHLEETLTQGGQVGSGSKHAAKCTVGRLCCGSFIFSRCSQKGLVVESVTGVVILKIAKGTSYYQSEKAAGGGQVKKLPEKIKFSRAISP